MSEIENAITVLENHEIRECGCPDCVSKHFAFELAIEALKEKQEREKGCEYCNGLSNGIPKNQGQWLNFVGDYATVECSKCGELYEVSDCKNEEHFNAFKQCYKYCPNCGAKMEESK